MNTRKRRSIEDRIAAAEDHLRELQALKRQAELAKLAPAPVVLTRTTDGMPELLAHIDSFAKQHKVKTADVIFTVSKFKRAGLTLVK